MDIGGKIKEMRNAAGLTQSQLAQLSGVAPITIRQYETGKRQPRIEQLQKIAKALKVSVAVFLPEKLERKYLEYENIAHDIKRDMIDSAVDYEEYESARKTKISDIQIGLILGENRRKRLEKINASFDKLNDDGQQKAVERLEELAEIPRYQKSSDDQGSKKMPVAAHGGGVTLVDAPDSSEKQKIERLTKEALDESFDEDEEF